MLHGDKPGQHFDRGVREHLLQGQFDPQSGVQGSDELNGQNRMPAQFEKIVVQTYPLDVQRLLP